jgi:hypothetical protein
MITLRNESEVVSSQQEKLRLTFEHFQQHIGSCPPRKYHINFVELQWQPIQLHHLDLPFIELKVASTIKAMPKEKSPGSDGFIGIFFKESWGGHQGGGDVSSYTIL